MGAHNGCNPLRRGRRLGMILSGKLYHMGVVARETLLRAFIPAAGVRSRACQPLRAAAAGTSATKHATKKPILRVFFF